MKRVAEKVRLELYDKVNSTMKNNLSIADTMIEKIWIPLYDAVWSVALRAVKNEIS